MSWGVVVDAHKEPPPHEGNNLPRITAWSYSRYAKWVECPKSAYFKFVLKLPEPGSPQMERGIKAHEHAASIITGQQLPGGAAHDTPLDMPWQRRLRNTHQTYKEDVEAELQMAFTADWKQTGWFAKDAWCRIVFDALIVEAGTGPVIVQEHKTGKPRTGHLEQATLYAAGVSVLAPGRDVEVTLNYFDIPTEKDESRVRHNFSSVVSLQFRDAWKVRAERMLADTEFPTRVGPQCRWCHFRKSNGGPCSKG